MNSLSHLLKESWALVEERQDNLAGYFYARLFLSNPQLRDLFPVHLDVQRERLLAALVNAMQMMDDPERFNEYLRSLGRDHRKFNVAPEHYETVRSALLDALRKFCGEQWSPAYEQAWRDGYDRIAAAMQRGAEEDAGNPPYWHAEVIQHERRSFDIAVFTVHTMEPLEYEAGQYLSVETHHQPRLWRPYSPANARRTDNTIDFHVRAVGAGWVSSALVRKLQPGDMLKLAAPMGSMTLNRQSARDIVFVAGGTGLAPIKAMLEVLAGYNRKRWVHLYVGAPNRDDLYDLETLQAAAERFPWLQVIPACSDDPGWGGEEGNISDVVARYGPWDNHDFFVSGSPDMVKATLRTLSELRVPSVRVQYDAFGDL